LVKVTEMSISSPRLHGYGTSSLVVVMLDTVGAAVSMAMYRSLPSEQPSRYQWGRCMHENRGGRLALTGVVGLVEPRRIFPASPRMRASVP